MRDGYEGDGYGRDAFDQPFPAILTGSVSSSGTYYYQWSEVIASPTTGAYSTMAGGRVGTYNPTGPSGINPTQEVNNTLVATGTIVYLALRSVVAGNLFYDFVAPGAATSGSVTSSLSHTSGIYSITTSGSFVATGLITLTLAPGTYLVWAHVAVFLEISSSVGGGEDFVAVEFDQSMPGAQIVFPCPVLNTVVEASGLIQGLLTVSSTTTLGLNAYRTSFTTWVFSQVRSSPSIGNNWELAIGALKIG